MQLIGSILFSILLLNQSELNISYQKESDAGITDEWIPLQSDSVIDWKASYWIKAQFRTEKAGEYVLQGGNWYMESMDFYSIDEQRIGSGNSLKMYLTKGDTSILIRYPFIDQKSSNQFDIQLEVASTFVERAYSKNLFQAVFLSIIAFLLLMSIVFILRSNDLVYVHYAFYLFSVLYFFAYQYGILSIPLPFVKWVPPALVWISSASLTMAYLFFAQSFLDLRHKDPFNFKLMRFGQYYVGSVVVIETVCYLFDYDIQHALYYKILIVGPQVPLMILFLYRVYKLKNVLSYIFLAGASILVLTTLAGQSMSTFQLVIETNIIIQVGLLLDIFIFSFGIGVRVGLIYKAREEAQSQLIEQLQLNEQLQQEYTQKLEKKVAERTVELRKKNQENETLLKEIHHRVKNNLQMISSLLNIQARRLVDIKSKEVLNVTKTRIRSIGLIHEHLYNHDHLSTIELKTYIEDLVNMLEKTMFAGDSLKTSMDIVDKQVDFDTAITIGLVLNELVTNSLKYAFIDHQQPQMTVTIQERQDQLEIYVHDNGPGVSEEPAGFGWSIIHSTLESTNGEVSFENADGLTVGIKMKDYVLS